MSSSEDSDRQVDDEGAFHGFRSSTMISSEEEMNEEDRRELDRILGIIQGRTPPEQPPRRRLSTRDDLLEAGTPTTDQARRVPHHPRRTPTPPQASSSDEDTPLRRGSS